MADDLELTTPPLKPPLHNSSRPSDKEPDDSDLDKIRKWQEDRIARKLRGEYESAVFHLTQVVGLFRFIHLSLAMNTHFISSHQVNENLDTPSRISAIRVEGANRTRKSFLASLVRPYLPARGDPIATLESVLHQTRSLGSLLQETDIFESVIAKLEASQSVFAQPGDVDVVLKTREKGRFYLNTSTQVGNNEGGAVSSPTTSFELPLDEALPLECDM